MPADAFWTLAMAVNVYLTFYHKFDAERLRRMEPIYLVCCYGIPFVPAFTYIFIQTKERGRFYGNATLWCWVTSKWDIWRIATFYGPVWLVICTTFFIYLRAGGQIYRKHKQLRQFSNTQTQHEPEPAHGMSPTADGGFGNTKTTEVFVTSEVIANPGNAIDMAPLGRRGSGAAGHGGAVAVVGGRVAAVSNAAYSVTISSNARRDSSGYDGVLPTQPDSAHHHHMAAPITPSMPPPPTSAGLRPAATTARRAAMQRDNAAWSYTKCAILFFTALLVTWIPSSANRVYSVIYTNQVESNLEFMSAFVLPLQGFWNAIIYIVTSWKATKAIFVRERSRDSSHHGYTHGRHLQHQNSSAGAHGGKGPGHHASTPSSAATYRSDSFSSTAKAQGLASVGRGRGDSLPRDKYESDSMTELSSSRPGSNESKHRQ